jgi:hypothetical protein
MISIVEHIEYLMMRHDCVVVPGWGAFIANYSPAAYREDGTGLFERPRRSIGFSSSVDHNDGMLAQSLVRREGISYDAAMRHIADSVAAFRRQLDKGGEVSMGSVGYFRRVDGRYNEFVSAPHVQVRDRYFGLTDLDIKPVSVLEQEAEAPAAVVPTRRNLFVRKAVRVAASVAVLLGLGILLSTPIIVDRSHDTASMAPTVTAPQSQQLAPTVEQGIVNTGITRVEAYPGIARVGNTTGKYRMVVATLRNQQELDAFKTAHADLVPYMKILDYKGMMCVYVASSDDYSQLMSLRDELPERLRDVWIYN